MTSLRQEDGLGQRCGAIKLLCKEGLTVKIRDLEMYGFLKWYKVDLIACNPMKVYESLKIRHVHTAVCCSGIYLSTEISND
jgi:hypothetical protein